MIARMWRGRTRAEKSADYLEYLERTGLSDCRATEGNRGVQILLRTEGDVAEFLFFSFWEDLDAIRGFAGPDLEKAVYYPEDEAFLLEKEPTVVHYEVAAGGPDPSLRNDG